MQYRQLGRSGLRVSTVGVGCNNFGRAVDEAGTRAVIDKAIDLGVTLFDTADVYGPTGQSELLMGKVLGARRKDVIIATKFGFPMGEGLQLRGGGSRDYIMRAAEASLKRLQTDYIDLYQIHTPDPVTPIAETLRAMDDLVRQGKVRYIGNSNFLGYQIADAAWTAREQNSAPFISAQNQYSIMTREIETDQVPACEAHGLGVLPYFPLESGMLSGKYKLGAPPPKGSRWEAWKNTPLGDKVFSEKKLHQVSKLEEVCASFGHSMLDMAIGWLLSRSYVSSVIAGATKPEQIEQNVKAAAWRPSAEESAKIDEITAPPKRTLF